MNPHLKSVSRRASSHSRTSTLSHYEEVTNRVIEALDQGTVPWRKPWHDMPLPVNAISNHTYRGVNVFLLALSPYRDHRWVTFQQARQLGGNVRLGEHSTPIVFWKRWLVPREQEDATGHARIAPLLRFFHVFNVEQCEGLTLDESTAPRLTNEQRIQSAEHLVAEMPNPPRFREEGSRACYMPSEDIVFVPSFSLFTTPDSYYATLFHELGHATGHQSRLDRPGIVDDARFGSEEYSREELIAEFASAFCCAALGLDNSLIENAARYINGWRTSLTSDPKAVVSAAAYGQKAADYIRAMNSLA